MLFIPSSVALYAPPSPVGEGFFYPPLLTIHLLIVVIAIMAILAAVLVPTVTSKISQAKESSADSSCSALANSIQADVMSALAATGNTFKGQYCTVTVFTENDTTKVKADDVITEYTGNGAEIKISTNENVIQIKHKDYGWYYTVDHTGKVTKVTPNTAG